ncbi:MAG: hypothetical protein K9M80_00255 [Candidatus Marinimicrobia bacterium]|nr:hypothetical protein [Candidatus Neomarinimicrobiota bacterium]
MKKRTIVLTFTLIILFIVSIGIGLYLGMREDRREQKRVILYPGHIRVMQYNINHGLTPQNKSNLGYINELIQQEQPDILCINSIDNGVKRSGYINQPRKLRETLKMQHSWGEAFQIGDGWSGNAIYTRFPIEFAQNVLFRERNKDQNAFLYVALGYEGIELHVLTTSLKKDNFKIRLTELENFISERGLNKQHVIIAATVPAQVDNREILDLNKSYYSIFDHSELKYSFPAKNPEQRYDHLFFSKNIKILEGKILHTELTRKISTHLPLSANIDIQ